MYQIVDAFTYTIEHRIIKYEMLTVKSPFQPIRVFGHIIELSGCERK